jgi:hypothetical protein
MSILINVALYALLSALALAAFGFVSVWACSLFERKEPK